MLQFVANGADTECTLWTSDDCIWRQRLLCWDETASERCFYGLPCWQTVNKSH